MIKRTISKPFSFIKSLLTKRQRAKLYVRGLEDTIISLRCEVDAIKIQKF